MPVQKTPSSTPQNGKLPQEDPELLPYVLANEIGKGSFATVYRGYHEVSLSLYPSSLSLSSVTAKPYSSLYPR